MNPDPLKLLSIALIGAGFLALNGCANTNEVADKGKQALVCPQCKMVAVRTIQPAWNNNARGGWAGTPRSMIVYEDQCTGCQGAITT